MSQVGPFLRDSHMFIHALSNSQHNPHESTEGTCTTTIAGQFPHPHCSSRSRHNTNLKTQRCQLFLFLLVLLHSPSDFLLVPLVYFDVACGTCLETFSASLAAFCASLADYEDSSPDIVVYVLCTKTVLHIPVFVRIRCNCLGKGFCL